MAGPGDSVTVLHEGFLQDVGGKKGDKALLA